MPTRITEAGADVLVLMGDAPCLEEDMKGLRGPFKIMAINRVGIRWPGAFEYWASWHPDEFPKWEQMRSAKGYPGGYVMLSHFIRSFSLHVPVRISGGSSSLYGVNAAREMGFRKIITAGVVLKGPVYVGFQRGWEKAAGELETVVRGLSGYPRERFGFPTPQWLKN